MKRKVQDRSLTFINYGSLLLSVVIIVSFGIEKKGFI